MQNEVNKCVHYASYFSAVPECKVDDTKSVFIYTDGLMKWPKYLRYKQSVHIPYISTFISVYLSIRLSIHLNVSIDIGQAPIPVGQ